MPYYALQTPSGIVLPMGKVRPKLTEEDRRDFWKVIRIRGILKGPEHGGQSASED